MDNVCTKCGKSHSSTDTVCDACGTSLVTVHATIQDPAQSGPSAPSTVGESPSAQDIGTQPTQTPLTGGDRPDTGKIRDTLVGSMVGEYQITGIIGKGGMGTVYSAVQPLIGKDVAVKVLKPSLSDDQEMLERFLAEARAVNKIRHPNIVDIFSFGRFEDGTQYCVMEYLHGQSLATYLKKQKSIWLMV